MNIRLSSIYLEHNASTPIHSEVRAAMEPFLTNHYGNPSATNWAARPAARAIARSRARVADLIEARPDEIVPMSSGSEANNTVLKGVFEGPGSHYVTTRTEHPSILAPLAFLESCGAEVSFVPVDRTGRVDPEDVRDAIRPATVLVSIMHANNETGTIQPVYEIGRIARERGVRFHSDSAQSVGKIPVSVDELGVDFLTLAGHKFYAPKGVGALYARAGVPFERLIHGGAHQEGRRSSTESAVLAVALGTAAHLAIRRAA